MCVNTFGSYSCCRQGRTGADCQTDIDECENPESCHRHGRCINTNPGYRCECAQGYNADEFCAPSCSTRFTAEPTLTPPPATNDDGTLLSTTSAASAAAGNTDGGDGDGTTFESRTTASNDDGGGAARSSDVTAAAATDGLPGTTPSAEARAGDGDGGGGGISALLDYWYYVVPALAVLIAVLAFAAYRSRKAFTCAGGEYYDVAETTTTDGGKSPLAEESYYSMDTGEPAGLSSLDVNAASAGDDAYEYYYEENPL